MLLSKLFALFLFVTVFTNFAVKTNAEARQSDGNRGRSVRTTTTTTPKPEMSFHYTFQSPICIVKKLAEFNNVTWTYTFVGKQGPYFSKNFRYALELGDEEYEATSITKKSAEELVSEKALNETSYRKPPKSATDDCNYSKSALELVHELAQKYKFNLTYDVHEVETRKFIARCIVDMIDETIITDGEGPGKRQAKLEAAERMWARLKIVDMNKFRGELSKLASHNASDVTQIHPVSRLYEIQRQNRGKPPIFRLRPFIPMAENEINGGNFKLKLFAMEATVDNISSIGTGKTIKEAKRNAAAAVLKAMRLPV